MASRRESPRAARVSEATGIHTRLLRLALGVEESRTYWERVDPAVPVAGRGLRAVFSSPVLYRVLTSSKRDIGSLEQDSWTASSSR
ncbi:MAG: hypothetical protein M3O36_04545 [Myxococcota bacterium]|nr:hypothetical protein [Myxococcota bacterium]